jgi:hypothetical protein
LGFIFLLNESSRVIYIFWWDGSKRRDKVIETFSCSFFLFIFIQVLIRIAISSLKLRFTQQRKLFNFFRLTTIEPTALSNCCRKVLCDFQRRYLGNMWFDELSISLPLFKTINMHARVYWINVVIDMIYSDNNLQCVNYSKFDDDRNLIKPH